MDASEVVLGFDVRELWLAPGEEWPERRRRVHLMRADVVRPLSVDEGSWRSVFEADASLQRPPWTGPIQSLWEDPQALDAHLAGAWGDRAKAYAVVAVTLVAGACSEPDLARWWDGRVLSPAPDGSWQAVTAATPERMAAVLGVAPLPADESWERLGYDVADRWLTSGLTNCGAGEPTFLGGGSTDAAAAPARATYARLLNRHHLFAAVAPAAGFKRLCNRRVPEHAPFFVYGLWRRRPGSIRRGPSRASADSHHGHADSTP